MKKKSNFRLKMPFVVVALLAAGAGQPVLGEAGLHQPAPVRVETVNETHTSWIPRVITNIIEVRIPTNIFINVYRTNQIEAVRSNVVNIYRTNFVTHYQTNLQTLTLTNWETVLVMKTNRVTQRVPNVVESDLPAARPGMAKTVADGEALVAEGSAAGLALDTAATGKVTVDDLVEVRFKLKSADGTTPRLASYEWRVERTDGSVLLFGQEPEFRRELPMGTYKVEIKTRAASSSPLIRLRSVVEVTDSKAVPKGPALEASAR